MTDISRPNIEYRAAALRELQDNVINRPGAILDRNADFSHAHLAAAEMLALLDEVERLRGLVYGMQQLDPDIRTALEPSHD